MTTVAQAVAPKLNSIDKSVVIALQNLRELEIQLRQEGKDDDADQVARARWNLSDEAIEVRHARTAAQRSKASANAAAAAVSAAASQARSFVRKAATVAATLNRIGAMINLLGGLVRLVP